MHQTNTKAKQNLPLEENKIKIWPWISPDNRWSKPYRCPSLKSGVHLQGHRSWKHCTIFRYHALCLSLPDQNNPYRVGLCSIYTLLPVQLSSRNQDVPPYNAEFQEQSLEGFLIPWFGEKLCLLLLSVPIPNTLYQSVKVPPSTTWNIFNISRQLPLGRRKKLKYLPEIILPCMIKRYWQVPLRRVLSCGTQRMLLEKSRLRCKLDSLHQTKGFWW